LIQFFIICIRPSNPIRRNPFSRPWGPLESSSWH